MQKSLKTCSQCGTPIRVERSVTGDDVICGRCSPDLSKHQNLDSDDHQPATDANLMIGIGLMLFAPGLVLATAGALIGSFSSSHLKSIRYSNPLIVLGSVSSITGFFLVSISGLVCLFVPSESRAAKPLLIANGLLLVLILARVFNSHLLGRYVSLEYASVFLTSIWLFAWVFFLIRTATLVDRRDLAVQVAVVLPVVVVCFSIGLWLLQEVKSSNPLMQLIRVTIFSASLFAALAVFRLGLVFRSKHANQTHNISKQDRLQTS